jgi:PAS domain S-box-containing protein
VKKTYKKIEEKLTSEGTELRQPVAELEAPATDHMQTGQLLRKTGVDKLDVLNSIAEIVIHQDTEHRILWTNKAAAESVGLTPAQLVGRHCYEIRHQRSQPCEGCPVTKARQTSKPQQAEITIPDGRTWFIRGYPILDEYDRVTGIIEVTLDITERKQAEEKYQAIVKTALDSFGLHDLEGRFLEVNDSCCKMFGYTREELLKMSIPDIEVVENPEMLAQHFKKIMEQGYDRFETRHKRKDGQIINAEVSANYLDVEGGRFFVFVRDINERKLAEQALRDSDEKLKRMFDSVTDGIVLTALDGTIINVNQRTAQMHGFGSKGELVGKSAFDIVAPRDHERMSKDMRQALKRGIIRNVECTLLKADGSEFPAELSTSVMKDASGKVIGHITVSRDITERKKTEQALQAEKNKLQSLIDAMEDDLSIQDKNYNIIYQNESSKVNHGDQLGEKCYRAYEGKDKVCDGCPVEKAFKDGKSHTSERKVVTLSGEVTFFENTANPIRDAGGEIVACLEVGRNITERKKAEEREKELQKELYLSSRLAAIGELAAGVAHQINNPLTGVLGFSQRLLRKIPDQETKQDLKRIYTEAERAAKVVQNLLTFARRRQPRKQYSDINEILESALELRAYELKTSNIEVVTDLDPKLPEIMLDFYQIQEVFLNIILNAEQALTEAHNGGKLTIMTVKRRGYVRTTFTDDGPGIPAERLDNIFDPFYTTKAEKGGTGLGLSICHGIITEHGGKIYAKSKPGKGATFFVELPLTHN